MHFAARGLRVRYPVQDRWAVDGVDLDLAPARVTWVAGALGSGTSTLLLALAGLAPRITGGQRDGTVTADGVDVATFSPLTRSIAYLGSSPSLQISGVAATVRDEVGVGPMNLGFSRDDSRRAVESAMERLRVHHLADRAPGALSGGETQRVLLAALLATAPRAWLLDEPFSALDHASTVHLQQLLGELARNGATVVVACDDADLMIDVADRLIVMQDGRIVLDGDPDDLMRGDAIITTGAGTTDAATLARAAGMAAPRPMRRSELLERTGVLAGIQRQPAQRAASVVATSATVAKMSQVAFAYDGGAQVLDGVTFELAAGEAVGLFGSNGAGKSTLLRLAMALEHPGRGFVETLGRTTERRHPEDFAPAVGFLFQQPERQLFAASVRAECALAPQLARWDARRTAESIAAVLDELGLTDTADEHPYDLPLPRRRLVALAAILTADPGLILLDEPTAALDFASRERVIRVIRERTRRGKAVLAITHDAGFAHEALDRGLLLERGQVVHDGPVRDVIDDQRMVRPAALTVALALGLEPGQDRRDEAARALR
jgi:energy-coupling factor transport system ATP-binding protein